jgi:hypothetical protein
MKPSPGQIILLSAIALVALVLAILLWVSAPQATAPERGTADPGADPSREATDAEPGDRESMRPHAAPIARQRMGPAPGDLATISDRIEGRVLRQDGSPAPAGTTVIARRWGRVRIDPEIVAAVLGGDPSVPTARTGSDGGFVLEQLEAGSSYLLCAAGGGFLTKTTDVEARTGATDALLRVSRLYGVGVRLQEVGGAPLRSEIDLALAPPPSFGRADPFADPALLDLVGADLSAWRGPGRRLYLFTSQVELPMLREVPLRFQPAGYAPIELKVDVPPVLPALAERKVELEPVAAGWGELVVGFADGRDPAEAGPLRGFQVELAPASGAPMRFDLPRGPGEKCVRGIPFGHYSFTLRNAIRQTVYPTRGEPAVPVEIGPEAAAISVSLAGAAEVEIDLRTKDDRAYAGPATLRLVPGNPPGDGTGPRYAGNLVQFDKGPYVLGGLLPGAFTLVLDDPPGTAEGSQASFFALDLKAGATTRARFVLR